MTKPFELCSDLRFRLDFLFAASVAFSPHPLFSGLCSSFLSHLVAKYGRSTVQQAHEKAVRKNSRSENKSHEDLEYFTSLFPMEISLLPDLVQNWKEGIGYSSGRWIDIERKGQMAPGHPEGQPWAGAWLGKPGGPSRDLRRVSEEGSKASHQHTCVRGPPHDSAQPLHRGVYFLWKPRL